MGWFVALNHAPIFKSHTTRRRESQARASEPSNSKKKKKHQQTRPFSPSEPISLLTFQLDDPCSTTPSIIIGISSSPLGHPCLAFIIHSFWERRRRVMMVLGCGPLGCTALLCVLLAFFSSGNGIISFPVAANSHSINNGRYSSSALHPSPSSPRLHVSKLVPPSPKSLDSNSSSISPTIAPANSSTSQIQVCMDCVSR